MTLTPRTGLAAEKEPNEEAEDVIVDGVDEASDDVTVDAASHAAAEEAEEVEVSEEASIEAPQMEAAEITAEDVSQAAEHPVTEGSEEAIKASAAQTESTRVTPVPLFPKTGDDTGDPTLDEVTVARAAGGELARPSINEDEEEETKVETEETAIHAAAIRGDLEGDLSAQASVHRDKALRKSSDLEFSEPDADLDDEVVSAGPVLDEDDDGIEVGAHLAPKQRRMEDYSEDDSMFGHSPGPSALVAALSARRPATPPTGTPVRTDGFGSARLPTPVPGSVLLPVIGANLPAPASSPFGKTASVPPPYGSGRSISASTPALQIPAPSGAAATATDGAGLFRKVPIPVGGLGAVGLSCVVAGVIIGWVARGGGTPAPVAPAPMATTAPRVAPAPAVPPPVVQPVAAPPAATPTAVAGAAPIAPPATALPAVPEVAAAKPATPPEPEAAGEGASRSPAKRVAARRTKPADDEEPTTAKQVASAKPIASKPTKTTGKTGKKVWIDPFAD